MKKNIIYIIMTAMGFHFLVVSLLCTFIFQKIQFIAFKHAFTDCIHYLYEFPLNIVFSISVIMIIAGIIGIVKTK
jgi:hypothetical protein